MVLPSNQTYSSVWTLIHTKGRRRRLGEEEQAAMISKFALILLIFNNILIQSISDLHVHV